MIDSVDLSIGNHKKDDKRRIQNENINFASRPPPSKNLHIKRISAIKSVPNSATNLMMYNRKRPASLSGSNNSTTIAT